MAKKKSMSMGKLIMTILAIVCGAAICLPLFLNVWNRLSVTGNITKTIPLLGSDSVSGYFADYSDVCDLFKLYDGVFMSWASVVAGIALIVALIGAVSYIIGAIMKLTNSKNKLCNQLTKFGAIIMLVAGIIVLVASLFVVLPVASQTALGVTSSVSASFAIGGWIGFIAPIAAGVLGIMSCKK